MNHAPDVRGADLRLARSASAAETVATAVAALVLAGWVLDVAALRELLPGTNPMVATAALSLLLLAGSLSTLRRGGAEASTRWAGRTMALGAALIGLLKLAEYAFGWDLGLDPTLLTEDAGAFPGQMSVPTAITFVVLGASLATLDLETRRGTRPAQWMALSGASVALLGLIGRFYDVPILSSLFAGTVVMALPDALAVLVLCAGILAARPQGKPMRLIVSPGPAGVVLRRLVPAAVLFMVVAGGLRLMGQRAGLFGTALGVALLVFTSVIVLSLLIWRSAWRLEQIDRRRRIAEARLEQANRAKNEFLLRMSHEVRTPLNAILGFGQLMEMDEPAPEHREHLRHIMAAGQQLFELVNEVLDLARIETGRLAVSLEPVPLREVVDESVGRIRPLAEDRGIDLTVDLDGADGHVTGDRLRLEQVFVSLLDNAVRYGPRAGKVTMTCRRADGRTRVEVTDGGPGVPTDLRDRLFVPFDRLGAEDTGVEGTGLGLALSKVLVEAMGGSIGVCGEENPGSTFWVELSAASISPDEATPDPPAAEAGTEGPRSVLYIEDNEANFRLVERILARRPEIELLWAAEGLPGLEMARRHRPDLILLDINLPDIDGGEVLRRIQDDPSLRDTPVLVLSADALVEHVERLLASGARAYLTKPLNVEKLLNVLDGAAHMSTR